jgi:hypothetical protein
MDEISALLHGFAVVTTPMNLLLMFVGIILGVLIGVLPGLGGANGVAILLPLTFSMSPTVQLRRPGVVVACGWRNTARQRSHEKRLERRHARCAAVFACGRDRGGGG